jgi:hypothetical protein
MIVAPPFQRKNGARADSRRTIPMPENAIKQRLSRAIRSAVKCLDQPKGSYRIVLQSNGPFHIEAIREKEIRKIRIVLGQISSQDEREMREIKLPSICTKEIWFRKQNERGFEKRDVI